MQLPPRLHSVVAPPAEHVPPLQVLAATNCVPLQVAAAHGLLLFVCPHTKLVHTSSVHRLVSLHWLAEVQHWPPGAQQIPLPQ